MGCREDLWLCMCGSVCVVIIIIIIILIIIVIIIIITKRRATRAYYYYQNHTYAITNAQPHMLTTTHSAPRKTNSLTGMTD